jgi:hypothetical protein
LVNQMSPLLAEGFFSCCDVEGHHLLLGWAWT